MVCMYALGISVFLQTIFGPRCATLSTMSSKDSCVQKELKMSFESPLLVLSALLEVQRVLAPRVDAKVTSMLDCELLVSLTLYD